jgi:hypothetical protein
VPVDAVVPNVNVIFVVVVEEIEGVVHVTFDPEEVQVVPDGVLVADLKVRPAGTVSVITTFVAAAGPSFLTATVYAIS